MPKFPTIADMQKVTQAAVDARKEEEKKKLDELYGKFVQGICIYLSELPSKMEGSVNTEYAFEIDLDLYGNESGFCQKFNDTHITDMTLDYFPSQKDGGVVTMFRFSW
jgi:hypothetical protein